MLVSVHLLVSVYLLLPFILLKLVSRLSQQQHSSFHSLPVVSVTSSYHLDYYPFPIASRPLIFSSWPLLQCFAIQLLIQQVFI
jgi:hypothetical protein